MASRYLLLLGSNLATAARLDVALAELASLGRVALLAPVTRTPARHDPAHFYFNALAQLDCALDRAALVARMKRLETELGRVRDANHVVAVDIDLLATFTGGAWHADPHAVAKREFSQSPARELLLQSGLSIRVPTDCEDQHGYP